MPLITKWLERASDDPNVIHDWFQTRNSRNIGMTLGGKVGVIGFDIDGEYGRNKLEQLFGGIIPPTWEFSTPGNGSRLLFRVTKEITFRSYHDANPDAEHEELALLADGKMTVIPPSLHQNGDRYRWTSGRGPGDLPLAELPDHVLPLLRSDQDGRKDAEAVDSRPATYSGTNRKKRNRGSFTHPSSDTQEDLDPRLQTLSKRCVVLDHAISEQISCGCSEPRWHEITSMLVRAGYTNTAMAFSQLSHKHNADSNNRIMAMDAEGDQADYGPTRCVTFGCDTDQISSCHGTVRQNQQTGEPTNSPAALLWSGNKKKAGSANKPSLKQFADLITGNYGIHDNNLCQIKYKKEGDPDRKPIANFVARIVKTIKKDTGAEKITLYHIDGMLIESGKHLPRIEVIATEFEAMKWLPQWGPEPNIFPGNVIRDMVRFAIQSTAHAATTERVYSHLGWIKREGQWKYLHAGGALGDSSIKVELDTRLQYYRLPDNVPDPRKAMEASLALLKVAPHRVTLALWGLTYLAPLCEWMRQAGYEPKFLLWLYGYTGSRKTTLAKLFLCHFGNLLEHPPSSFKDTANAVEKRSFDAKDSLLLIDDYHPTSSQKEKQIMESLAQKLARGYGDRVARGRMKQDTSLRADYLPRGMALVTAEDKLNGGSSAARIFPAELLKTDVDLSLLTTAQQHYEQLSEAMKGYLEWVGQAMNEPSKDQLKERFVYQRQQAAQLDVHGRLIEASVWLYLGLQLGLEYAESIGAIAREQAQSLLDEAWSIFLDSAHEQGEEVTQIKPSKRFCTIVSQLLASGSIHTSHPQGEIMPETVSQSSRHVGYHDDDYYCFMPDLIYSEVVQFMSRQGALFPISASMLWKELGDAGLTRIETTKENNSIRHHYLYKRTIRGDRKRLLWLKKEALHEKVEKKPAKKADDSSPPYRTCTTSGRNMGEQLVFEEENDINNM